MNAAANSADPPMAEPGKRPTGADVGGVAAAPQAGVAEAMQRSMERREQPVIGRASTGDAAGGASDPRIDLGGKAEPGSAPGTSARTDRPASDDRATAPPSAERRSEAATQDAGGERGDRDDEEEWRHEPVAPVDETNPLRSLGKAVGDTITGSGPDAKTPRKP